MSGAWRRTGAMQCKQVRMEALKDEFWHWQTSSCGFNFILADKLRSDADGLPRMITLQQLRKQRSDLYPPSCPRVSVQGG